MIRCWRLDDDVQTLVLGSHRQHLAEVIYWGPPLPAEEDSELLYRAKVLDTTGGMLDSNPELSICPEATRSFPGQPGLTVRDTRGEQILPEFYFISVETSPNRICLNYRDQTEKISYRANFEIHPDTHIIESSAEIEADVPLHLQWLAAPVLPAPQDSTELIDFSGRWCSEFQLNRTPWSTGIRCRENRTGRTGHEHFPGLIIPCNGANNTEGRAYAFHYGWSGGHRMVCEELPDGRRQIQFGHATSTEIKRQLHFTTAPLYFTFSDTGINGCSIAFQRHLREHIVKFPDPLRPRPVNYNCWEAVYFNHNVPELKDIATRAAKLGAERFVLDDGWFGERDDDTRSLSDWTVDPRKYPQGLNPLITHVHDLGMSFGIWFEPEMINPDSQIHRQYPHWTLGSKCQVLGRHQKVINMALPEVREFLFERICDILTKHDIDYIKWDHNRVLPTPDAEQARGTYQLIDRLREAFPKVEIESCASGGGRIDFGILSRTQRVWLSDSNDALERLKIQHNAALFLPALVTGSHVGPRHCHTSGRVLDMRFRAWVAAQRHMGFEMDPRELSDEEAEILAKVTHWWKDNRDWMMQADILRLDSDDPCIIAEQQLANNGSRFVAFIGKLATSDQVLPRPLKLTGLDPVASYIVTLVNQDEAVPLSRGNVLLKRQSITVSGQYLMTQGLNLPWSYPETMWVLQGKKL